MELGPRMAAFRGISHCYQRPDLRGLALLGLHDGPRPLEGGVRRDPRLDRRGHRDRGAQHALLLDRVQEDPAPLLHGRAPQVGGRARLTAGARAEAYARALRLMPGGVNSPVRAMRAIGRDPLFVARGEGAELVDVDGNRYVDWVMSWGPLIAGHAHPDVVAAVTAAAAARHQLRRADRGGERRWRPRSWSACPRAEMVRMTSSGTEASMSAIRLARAATGRDAVLKFAGAYHGHVDGLLAEAGSGLATQGIPASPGVTDGAGGRHGRGAVERPRRRWSARWPSARWPRSSASPTRRTWASSRPSRASSTFLREPPPTGRRAARLRRGDLRASAWRRGGAQEREGVTPDLTVLGKVIGGGLPAAAYAGRARPDGAGRARPATSTRRARCPATRWPPPPGWPRCALLDDGRLRAPRRASPRRWPTGLARGRRDGRRAGPGGAHHRPAHGLLLATARCATTRAPRPATSTPTPPSAARMLDARRLPAAVAVRGLVPVARARRRARSSARSRPRARRWPRWPAR